MVARHALNVKLLVRVQTPQPKRILPPLFDAVKGGGEVKKKQRCFVKRFAALVAALVLCSALCIPCFASNNASSKKWKIVASEQKLNEMGTMSTYFQLSPYENGSLYRAYFSSRVSPISVGNSGHFDYWITPYNWPDWWRSSIPLGARSYMQVDDIQVASAGYDDKGSRTWLDSPSSVYLYAIDKRYLFDLTTSYSSSALALSGSLYAFPYRIETTAEMSPGASTSWNMVTSTVVSVPVGGSYTVPLQTFKQVVLGFNEDALNSNVASLGPFTTAPLNNNISSDDLVFGFIVATSYPISEQVRSWLDCTAIISFWVDANKLPAGLEVGDEFPADTDAFDQLRDDLIEQFPEAGDNIENGKDTIQGWNDTETVDTDVASTSISALNALFQNLGGFLFIISLMVFGAVVLRMLIRKAVDG